MKIEYLGQDGKWHNFSTLEKEDSSVVRKFGENLGLIFRPKKYRMIRLREDRANEKM